MNWQNNLKAIAAQAVVAPAVAAGEHPMVAKLEAAAKAFAPRTDSFATGKAATCRDIAAKLRKYGSFASAAQEGFANKLVVWSQPRDDQPAKPSINRPMDVLALYTVLQKHTKFYAGDLTLTRRNQDTLCWVIWKGQCVGKIDNGFAALFTAKLGADHATVRALLVEFNANPLAAAVKYGRLSGLCCSCGRDLTNEGSIEAGIGPVCAGRFA